MRILHVIATASGWGGLERCVTDLANQQSATHTVAAAGAEGVLQRLNPAVQKLILPMQHSRRDPRLLWAMRRAVREFRPEVIHAHAGKGAALIHSSRWLLPRLPRVATIHGTKKHLGFLRHFDGVITVSRRAGASLGDIPHTVIWNAIPPMERPVKPADLSGFPFLGQGKPVFACVGRLVEEKAFDVLLRAMRDVDGYLWIIGDGTLRPSLEALATELRISDRIWFAGFRSDVPLLMCLAEVMVISSRREGFPLTLVESLHLQRPVIGTRVAGVEEILPAEWSCEPENAPALSALMKKTASQLNRLDVEFAPLFELAQRELRLDRAADKIEAVYREAIKSLGTELKRSRM
jgi:glycosyltransferase involved in cell wall biosynthesis